jgi:predicted Rossmann-fold nucleotide-binding protein
MAGFDPAKPASMADIPDFSTYRYFVVNGRATPADPYAGMMEALHDNSILQAMFRFLDNQPQTAAIMGGHNELRGSVTFRAVVQISKRLTEAGFLMASGGGPGAMEATHLGAILKGRDESAISDAVDLLIQEAELPDSTKIVDNDGVVDQGLVAKIHKWALPAFQLYEQIQNPGVSLAVPTWHYGHEPLTPLATHVAKYFLNSIREDVLLALATNGIVYAPGRAGTLQEVFQDAAQNYYHGEGGTFAPMVFFDTKFWRETLPIELLLEALFVKNGRGDEYKAKVRFFDEVDEVVDFLTNQPVSVDKTLARFQSLGMGPIMVQALASESAYHR